MLNCGKMKAILNTLMSKENELRYKEELVEDVPVCEITRYKNNNIVFSSLK